MTGAEAKALLEDNTYRVPLVCRRFNVHERTVRRWYAQPELPPILAAAIEHMACSFKQMELQRDLDQYKEEVERLNGVIAQLQSAKPVHHGIFAAAPIVCRHKGGRKFVEGGSVCTLCGEDFKAHANNGAT